MSIIVYSKLQSRWLRIGFETMNESALNELAIEAKGLSKSYKLYSSLYREAVDTLGIGRWLPSGRRHQPPPQHNALTDVDLNVRRGERLGLLGRNGAGKSTLLKILSEVVAPSSGAVRINGTVNALMRVGVGFHPEYTGIENIRASLNLSSLSPQEQRIAEADIVNFCELGDFIGRPLKTYSLGMKSRLQFACATAVKPDILIVDEILGAGDAYFSAKSALRMQDLTGGGCTLLLVSHSMGQIMQFCERAVWLEAGQIVADGATDEVVKRYEKFIHELRRQSKLSEIDTMVAGRSSDWLLEKAAKALNLAVTAKDESKTVAVGHNVLNRWSVDDAPLVISSVKLLNPNGGVTETFSADEALHIRVGIKAQADGSIPCCFGIAIYNGTGQLVGRHVSPTYTYTLQTGDTREVELVYDSLLYGTGSYFLSVSIHEKLDLRDLQTASWYDLYGRAFEFQMQDDPLDSAPLFRHPNRWAEVVGADITAAEKDFPLVSSADQPM
jgi:lipopolysaccharide transport system ATP-binding protein